MKKNALKSSFAGLCVGISAFLSLAALDAAEPANPAVMDECSKELLLSYFPEKFVNETLNRFKVPEDKWAGINATLSMKDKDIVRLVEQKAASMNPNPLKDPQQRQAAVKLFRETLLQVFTDALKSNGIQDTSQFQAMLDDIQQQKAKKFAQCMEKQREHLQNEAQKSSNSTSKDFSKTDDESDDNDDYDDEDEDDDNDNDNENYKDNLNNKGNANNKGNENNKSR